MTGYDSYPLSAERLERAFFVLLECQEQLRQLSEGTCIQFSLEADEDKLETCLAYFLQQGVRLEYLGVSISGLRNLLLTAS